MAESFCGTAAGLKRINPFICLITARHLSLVNAFIGKSDMWDGSGREVESPSAWWEMGLLDRADWQADWIGALFRGDLGQPVRLHILGRNSELQNRSFLRACMRRPSVYMSVILTASE